MVRGGGGGGGGGGGSGGRCFYYIIVKGESSWPYNKVPILSINSHFFTDKNNIQHIYMHSRNE